MTSLAYLFTSHSDDESARRTHVRQVSASLLSTNVALRNRDISLTVVLRTGTDDAAREALSTLYRTYASSLAEYAAAMTGSGDIAADVLSDVFVMLWERRAHFHPTTSVRAYLLGAVRHRALNLLRATRRNDGRHQRLGLLDASAVMPSPLESPDASITAADTRASLEKVLGRLTPYARSVLVFRGRDGMAYDEIASVLGTSPDAVRKQFFRAVAQVRAWLEEETAL